MDQPVSTAAMPARCPECGEHVGTQHAKLKPPTALTVVPVVLVLLLLAALAIWLYAARQTSRGSGGVGSAQILQPGVAHAGLRRIADPTSSEHEGAAFYDMVVACLPTNRLADLPGDPSIEFGFYGTQALLTERVQLGWPATWYHGTRYSRYDDAVARTGFQPMLTQQNSPMTVYNSLIGESGPVAPRPRWTWDRYLIAHRPPVEETGGVATWHDVMIWSALAVLGSLIVVWWLCSIVMWLCSRVLRIEWCKRNRRRLKVAMWLLGVVIVVMLNVSSIESSNRINSPNRPVQLGTSPNSVYWRQEGLKPTGFSRSTLLASLNKAETGRLMARSILKESPAADDNAPYLGIAVIPECHYENSLSTGFNQQFGLLSFGEYHFRRKPEFGPAIRICNEPGTKAYFERSRVFVIHCTGNPEQPTRYWSLGFDCLGVIICGTFMTWLIGRMIGVGWWRRMVRKRSSRNQCVSCGHALGPSPKLA